MPKKPEENKMKPTHGAKLENGLHALKKPKEKTEAGHSAIITHKHERKKRVERDCTKCMYATQVSATEWECSKKTYFPETLLCFVPRDVEQEVVE